MTKTGGSAPEQDTSSLSFLKHDTPVEEAQKVHIISNFKERFNPNSTNLKIRIPRRIEKIFKDVETIEYIYDFIDSEHIEIVDLKSGCVLQRVRTSEYGEFDFDVSTDKMVFIFGKVAFRTRQKSEQTRKYKECLTQGKKFIENDVYKDFRGKYFDYQIEHGVNFVYINGSQDLHMQIKALIGMLKDEGEYVPKTAKFSEEQRSEYLRNLLTMIPGVSEETSRAITCKFPKMIDFLDALLDKKLFTSIKVGNESGGWRNIPEKVYTKIYKAFHLEDGDEKL